MKVLHLHSGAQFGGVETILMLLARERALCPEMEPVYGVTQTGPLVDELAKYPVKVSVLGDTKVSRPYSVIRARRNLRQLLREDRPDVAICHVAKTYWLFGPVLRSEKVPTAYFLHSPPPTNMSLFDKSFRHGVPIDLFDRLISRMPAPDLLIGISNHTVQLGLKAQFPGARAATLHSPMPWPFSRYEMDAETRSAVRAEFHTPEDATVIVMAARLAPWKGHRNLMTTLSLLKDEPNWVMWMVGGPRSAFEEEFLAELKQRAKDGGVGDRVLFLGQRSDVPRLVGSSDIYCQANIDSEGFSVSFVEAFSAGVPVVTTDVGSAQEMLGGEAGLLAPQGDHAALAEALRSLIRDPARRKALGDAAKKRARALCDTGQQVNRLHELMQSILPANQK